MRIEYVFIKKFKNLEDFKINIDKSEAKTVLIGQNASGKSNFLEAVVLIFKHLDFDFKKDLHNQLKLGFEIHYSCYSNEVKIKYSDKLKFKWNIKTNGKNVSIKEFVTNKDRFLPRYILAYYSGLGNSNRLEEHFEDHKEKFARAVVNSSELKLPEFPRMQYAELIHSQFSLFSFFIDDDKLSKTFLKDNLFIENLQSTLLIVKEPEWKTKEGDPKFWGSKGVVSKLLTYLHDHVAIAPIRDVVQNKNTLWKKERKSLEVVYLFFSDFSKIRDFVKEQKWSSFDFFHILNTANVSRLLLHEGIRIRVKKKFASKISFKDLSEGEQQLLTVIGLMRFTSGEETLFLLDEPDTHLNPYWRWKYMDFITDIAFTKRNEKISVSTQVIMTSHDALTIGSLNKEAVRVFEVNVGSGKIETFMPAEDPKGMGVAGILTEIFKLKTTLDEKTFEQLERRRTLESKVYNKIELDAYEQKELESLNLQLDNLGFSRIARDPLYQKFQARFNKLMGYKKASQRPLTKKEVEEQNSIIDKILKDMLKEEGI